MNSNTKGLIAVLAVGGLAYFLYNRLYNPKKAVLSVISKNFPQTDSVSWINQQPKDYIKAWGKAILKGETSFTRNGQLRCTSGFLPKNNQC